MGASIVKVGEHWLYYDDTKGVYPGVYADAEAARWGSWAEREDVERICLGERRAITMEDLRQCLNRRSALADTHPQGQDAEERLGS